MTSSTSKTELRSPDGQRTSAAGRFTTVMMRCLRGGFVVVVAAALAVEWLHIDDLRRRVSELEHICQSASTDKHLLTLFDDRQPSLSDNQHFEAEV